MKEKKMRRVVLTDGNKIFEVKVFEGSLPSTLKT